LHVFNKLLEPKPGTLLGGKYRIRRTLGVGGMGVVVEATHVTLGHAVAVKLLRTSAKSGTYDRARFLREARIAAQLRSEHIAKVSDIGETDDGTPYVVMERLVGRDLAHLLHQGGPLPVDRAVTYLLSACEALAEAHAAGLVHRDVKPANLFLAERPHGREPWLKVLDFGLSKASGAGMAELTQSVGAFGTPLYMSPEQIMSTKHVDGATDQHALALVLYEALTNQPAFGGRNTAEIATNILRLPPPRIRDVRPDVPVGLDEACTRAMAKAPGDRFPDLGAFARAIAPFCADGEARLAAVDFALSRGQAVAGASGAETLPPESTRDDERTTIKRHVGADDLPQLRLIFSDAEESATSLIVRHPAQAHAANPVRGERAADRDSGAEPTARPSSPGSGRDSEPLPAWWTILAGFAIALSVVYVTIWLATQGAP
jgi:eukaryotic-like serine/threonine-protein kinase